LENKKELLGEILTIDTDEEAHEFEKGFDELLSIKKDIEKNDADMNEILDEEVEEAVRKYSEK
jgi:hypothetical protein